MMENARLEAKLEFQEKHEELGKEARALAAENAPYWTATDWQKTQREHPPARAGASPPL